MNKDIDIIILLAAYKGEKYIREQIESILAQDCDNWELIISDDGDYTSEIIDEYVGKYPDKIRHHVSGKLFGSAQKHFMHLARTFCGKSKYYMFCDQDDVWHNDKVRISYERMLEKEEKCGVQMPILVYTNQNVVDENLHQIGLKKETACERVKFELGEILVNCPGAGCTMMLNDALMELLCRDVPISRIGMHDYFVAILATAFGRIEHIPIETMEYRQHQNNVVGKKSTFSFSYIFPRLSISYHKKNRSAAVDAARLLVDNYGELLSKEHRKLLNDFISIERKNKIERLKVYRKYNIWKNGKLKKFGQCIFW